MNNHAEYQGMAGQLAAANAVRGATAVRVIAAGERASGRCGRAFALHQAHRASLDRLNGILGSMPSVDPEPQAGLSPQQEAELHAQLDERVRKVLGIIALMINDADADTAEMEDMLATLRALDREFFDFSGERDADGKCRPDLRMKVWHYYYQREFFTNALKAVREE